MTEEYKPPPSEEVVQGAIDTLKINIDEVVGDVLCKYARLISFELGRTGSKNAKVDMGVLRVLLRIQNNNGRKTK